MKNEPTKSLHVLLSAWQQSLLMLISGILLSLSFLDASYYIFAWVAYIPFLIAINGVSLLRSYCLGFMSGLALSVSTSYWIVDFLMLSKGYDFGLSVLWSLVFWLYCAQLSALIAVSFNWLKGRSRVHEFVLFPLVIVALYSAFPLLFPIRLGESQSQFLSAIQAIEFTGIYGLDAIIALSNIMMFRIIAWLSTRQIKKTLWPWLFGITSIVAWFAYGVIAMQSWNLKIENAEKIRVGIVQANEAPSLEKSKPYLGYSRAYPPEMMMTERLSQAGAEFVIWPEAKYKAYLDMPHVAKAYQDQLNVLNTGLVFQDIEHISASNQNTESLKYNTALMLDKHGQQLGQYQKMKRIPFGEYVPLVSDIPMLRAWVEGFFGKFLNEMESGKAHQFFQDEKVNIIPLICYEVMFPEFVTEAVSHIQAESEYGNLLVSLSSNGWFGATRQPYQHVNASILRAVENRIPLVHAVNNGPSIVALPTGKVIFTSDYHQAGGYIVDVPIVGSVYGSYFSQSPRLFVFSAYGILLLIVVLSFRNHKQRLNEHIH